MASEEHPEETMESVRNLPHEIITEILHRLPVKPLSRFKCVSKPWLSLISSPAFIKAHLQISSDHVKVDADDHTLILGYTKQLPLITFYACSLESLVSNKSIKDVKRLELKLDSGVKFDSSKVDVDIVGSCNGLYCIQIKNDLFLWNPSTRKSRKLPADLGYSDILLKTYYRGAGFGYDESSDDYKVVLITPIYRPRRRTHMVIVYSLNSNSWREIQDFNFLFCSERGHVGAFVSRNLHWAVQKLDHTRAILSCNIDTEAVGEVTMPIGIYSRDYLSMTVGVLRGCLCLIRTISYYTMETWIMKDYGVQESWTKIVSYTQEGSRIYSSPRAVMSLGAGEEDDGILVIMNGLLVLWNVRDGVFRYPHIRAHEDIVEFNNEGYYMGRAERSRYIEIEAAPYLESLVWPS